MKRLNGIGLIVVMRTLKMLYNSNPIKQLVMYFHVINGSYDMFGYKWRQEVNRKLAEGYIPTKEGWVKKEELIK